MFKTASRAGDSVLSKRKSRAQDELGGSEGCSSCLLHQQHDAEDEGCEHRCGHCSAPEREKRLCTEAKTAAMMEEGDDQLRAMQTSVNLHVHPSCSSSPSSSSSPSCSSASCSPRSSLSEDEKALGGCGAAAPAVCPAAASYSTPPSPYKNALSAIISEFLPDVLSEIVMLYYAAVLPGGHHYAGHAYLDNNAYFRFSNDYRLASSCLLPSPSRPLSSPPLLSPPLRLDNRSFSWSGWLNRVTTADNQFLFSLSNPHLHIPPLLSNLHVGYRHYQIAQRHVDCFTFGFWCNDLDAKNAADVTACDEWEHWAGTFEYPVSSPLPSMSPFLSILPSQLSLPPSLSSPSLGHRRLFRNGRLLCSDDCPAFIGRHCELAVGNRLVSSAAREGLKGGIADLRIWSRVLSEAEVAALYGCDEKGVRREALEVWYKFDESEEGLGVEEEQEEDDRQRRQRQEAEAAAGGAAERGRLLLDHSGHHRHASLIMPNEIRMIRHSGMQEFPKLQAWEGEAH